MTPTALPLIGITTYATNDQNELTLPNEYVESVRRAGGIPVLVAPGEQHVDQLLGRLDGLILAGGGDIAPQSYGGQEHPDVYMVDKDRDQTELALAQHLLDARFPTLAICRGIQIINVALGGTLYEHLPDHVGEAVNHRLPPREPVPHRVHIEPDSDLARVIDETTPQVMSWHHQGLRETVPELRVVARADDGVIEAVELADATWLMAVQWHPELTAHVDPTQQRLFDQLIRLASGSS